MAKVRLIQKTVSRRSANGLASKKKISTWYLDFGQGVLRSTGITDRKVAEQLREREEAKMVLSSNGLPDPSDYRRSLTEYIKDYEAKLIAPGRDNDYVKQTVAMIRKVVKACSWRTAVSIKASDVNSFAVKLHEKYASRTVHSHLTAIKGFTKWLKEQGKLAADPLAGVKSRHRDARQVGGCCCPMSGGGCAR